MDASVALKIYESIINLCKRKQIGKALLQLKELISKEQNGGEVASEVEQLQTSLTYLLDYFGKAEDPERGKFFAQIVEKTALLADRVNNAIQRKSSNEGWFVQCRDFEHQERVDFTSIVNRLWVCKEALMDFKKDVCCEEYLELQSTYEESLGNLFDYLRFSSEEAMGEVIAFEESKPYEWKYVALSACLIGLLHGYSKKRLQCVMDYADSAEIPIRNVAYVSLLIALGLYMERVVLSPDLVGRVKLIFSNSDFPRCFKAIQLVALQSRETDKLKKILQEQVFPDIMKHEKEFFKRSGWDAISSFEEADKVDWENSLEGEKIEENLQQLGELHQEGADINIIAFNMQKNHPFFKQAYAWFLPFDTYHSALLPQRKGVEELYDKVVGLFGGLQEMSNTDKYANAFTMLSGLNGTQAMIVKNMIAEAEDMIKERIHKKDSFSQKEANISQFIHDLYRFLCFYKPSFLKNIFKGKIDWYNIKEVREVIGVEDLVSIGNRLMKNERYKEALDLFNSIDVTEENLQGEVLQRKGYCFQMLDDIEEAIKQYENAELYTPENKWLIKQLAICHRKLENWEEALRYYMLLEEKSTKKEPIIFSMGLLYLEMKQYEKALNHFYKLQFMEWESMSSLNRAIAWTLFLLNKYEQSKNLYVRLLKEEENADDWLNYGHLLWVMGDVQNAIKAYKKSKRMIKGNEMFEKKFLKDRTLLSRYGISDVDLDIMCEKLR